MMRRVLVVAALLLCPCVARAQSSVVSSGPALPSQCLVNTIYITTSGTPTLYTCSSPNTWTTATSVSGFQSGDIIFTTASACRTGFTEVSALNGRMARGTLAANGNVGQTGGSDTYTPAGTISPLTFVGNAWAAPAIAWPAGVPTYAGTVNTLAVTAHTVVATKQGASAGNVVTTATHAITGVPGGTVAWPAGVPTIGTYTPAGTIATPTLSGTPATVVPAYLNLIACSKN